MRVFGWGGGLVIGIMSVQFADRHTRTHANPHGERTHGGKRRGSGAFVFIL